MQNPSGGPRAQLSGKAGHWAKGKHHASRKHNHGSRNNPRWTPMGPRPSRRPPNNQERFPAPSLQDQGRRGAFNAGPGAPRAPGYSQSGFIAPGNPRHAVLRTEDSPAYNNDQRAAPPGPRMFPRPFPPKHSPIPPPRPMRPYNNHHVAPPAPRLMFPRPFPPTLTPRPMRPNNMPPPSPTPDPPTCAPSDKTQLAPNIPPMLLNSSLPTFDLQAKDLVQQCLLSFKGQKEVDEVVSDVHQLVRVFLPDNVPILYGSMATGLALETSDIDCFIDSKCVPDGKERVQLLLKNYKLFYRRGTFQTVHRIPNARVPLVKAVHSRTGIEIDISCTSEAALHNTRLVKFLVQTDERIRPLIVLISLCYRLNGLAGTNRFVSYTTVLLVLFYLQNLEVPMLPPLNKIIRYVQDEPWPVNFTADVHSHLQAPNRSSLTELFSGFFKFYHSFEFGNNVLSTYMGRPVPVECFGLPDKLPDELSQLRKYYSGDPTRPNNFLNKFICVQDPMEHYINTTSYIQPKTLDHFKTANSYMVEMMANNPETTWLENMMKMTEEISALKSPAMHTKPNPDVQFNISYPRDESLSQEEWLARLKKDLLAVFKLLLFDVVEVIKEPEAKVRIADGPVHNRTLMAFELKSSFNAFTKRFKGLPEKVLKDPSLFQCVEKEMSRISEQMKRPSSSFHCEFTVKQPISPKGIPVYVQDINENASNTYLHLSGMLLDHLTGLLASAMKFENQEEAPKELNQQDLVVPKSRRDSGSRFVISYRKEEDEEEEAWQNRFKADLTSLFEFLLMEHQEVTSTSEKTEFLKDGEGESLLFAFQLQTPFNVFTKRFKNLYTQVVNDPSSIPSVKSEYTELSSGVNPLTVGTFHCEFLLIRSDCLPPDRVFAKMFDINKNLRNSFSHYSSNLQLNIGGLLDSIKKFRESQMSAV